MTLQLNSEIPIVDLFLMWAATERCHLITNGDHFLLWLSIACFRTLLLISNNNCYLTAKGKQTHCRLLVIPTKWFDRLVWVPLVLCGWRYFFKRSSVDGDNNFGIEKYPFMCGCIKCWWAPHLDYRGSHWKWMKMLYFHCSIGFGVNAALFFHMDIDLRTP